MLKTSRRSALVLTAIALLPPAAVLFFGGATQVASRQGSEPDVVAGIVVFLLGVSVVVVLASRRA